MAQYTYTWTTKSTSDKWPYDYPTRMTFLGLMKGGDRSVGSEENLIRPGKTYYFRVRGGGANDEAKWSEWISATPETRTAPAGRDLLRRVRPACVGGGDWLIRLRAPHEERQYADEYLETAMEYGRESSRDDLRQLLHGGQFQRRSLQVDRLYPHLGSGHWQGRHTALSGLHEVRQRQQRGRVSHPRAGCREAERGGRRRDADVQGDAVERGDHRCGVHDGQQAGRRLCESMQSWLPMSCTPIPMPPTAIRPC